LGSRGTREQKSYQIKEMLGENPSLVTKDNGDDDVEDDPYKGIRNQARAA
jgi:hypothetical protein